ncbi:MAG: beta-propeller domain-containing protein [Clostridia bacterium]|nr:beta-propeller domain-containing protein [Clostridia bacterium]
MKKEDIFNAFEELDPKFVEEAAPKARAVAWKSRVWTKIIAIAAAVVLVLGCIIIPTVLSGDGDSSFGDIFTSVPDELEPYKDSEYFEIIKKLHSDNEKRNNLPPSENIYGEPVFKESVEVTDNQTKGVEESDKIKRTDKHIFYMDGLTLRIFSIDGENSVEVDSYTIAKKNTIDVGAGMELPETHNGSEIFLSDDAKTVTVISRMYGSESYKPHSYSGVSYTDVHSFDVSDPANIQKKAELRIKGSYTSARMSEGKLLVFVGYNPYDDQIDYNKPESFLPVMDKGNGFELIPDCDIICNKDDIFPSYMIALEFDEKDLTLKKSFALYGSGGEPYVSRDKIFFHGNGEMSGRTITHTRIYCVDYTGESFKLLGSVKLAGHTIKNKWSMDEYEGVLRVVVKTRDSANLYCVSLESFKVIASVKDFAPKGEDVQSVRFEGTNAYVCTAVNLQNEILDPVFFFDLSDLNNISYKETGTIEGMSTSLIDYGNGYLIGIGNGTSDKYGPTLCLKIEVYKEVDDRVVSVCKYERVPISFSDDYKAYYINRQEQLLGFGYSSLDEEAETWVGYYTFIKFDSERECFVELSTVSLAGYADDQRGVYIDGYMYMFGENDFKVEAVDLGNTAPEQPEADGESQE